MIEYRFPEEKDFLLHYAAKLNDPGAEQILLRGSVHDAREAETLSKFYWAMVDEAVKDLDSGMNVAGQRDLEAWCEYTLSSIRSYLRANGYEAEWEAYS